VIKAYWINLWIWFSPDAVKRKDKPPDMTIWLEELIEAEQRTDFKLLCDFTLDFWR
jgi:hypothetical protein